ncbi:MAG: cytochrome-c peroxidase [Henriciella sp.]|nr:cytochrome-c peroxidase [Henriciella sp.]MBO6694163.1 cytochrome-c peroxidase [Henriciella sp.]
MKYRTGGLLAAALLVTACGGGGGGSTTTPPATGTTTNSTPVVSSTVADQTGNVGYDFSIDLAGTFTDADNDTLTITADFGGNARGLSLSGTVISGVPDSSGDVTITCTATDPSGASVSDTFTVSVTVDQSAISTVFSGSIDLDNLDDFAGQAVPNYITKVNDGGNPITNAGATLGRVLFYDTSLSTTGTVSCASCHTQSLGFSDAGVVSTGVEGGQTGRHSMRLINTMFADETDFFWDERAPSHEAQESQPIQDHNEMGFSGQNGRPDLDTLIAQMEATEYYEELFRFVFLDPDITEQRIQLALAQFTKSIQSFDSRYDTGRAQVNNDDAPFPNFTTDENAGKTLFMDNPNQGGAGCDRCHRAPEFDIAPNSNQNGIFRVAGSTTEFDLTNERSPSLRDLVGPGGSSNGPFMHDGSLATIRDVIDHYDNIQAPTTEPPLTEFLNTLDNRLTQNGNPQNLNLTDNEKDQLEAFLLTLTGVSIYSDAKLSDPF